MTRTRTAPLALAIALGLLLTAGCSSDDDGRGAREDLSRAGDAATPDTRPSTRPTPRTSTRPAARPGGDRTIAQHQPPPSPSGNALTVRAAGPDGHLIAGSALGGGWRVRTTADEDGRVMSPCHRVSMSDVGATRTRLRDFSGPGNAVQAVSRFVDRKSAWRVERVVQNWAEDCADDLDSRDAALGAVRHGAWLSVVEVSGVGDPRKRLRRALTAVDATF